MNRVCLDTSAYSYFKRGHAECVDVIRSAHDVAVPSVVLGELRAGFRFGSKTELNEAELRAFLTSSVVRVVPVDDAAASHYADLVVDLKRAGTPLPTNDIWIAAVALNERATVLTFDAHFEKIARVPSRVLVGDTK